MRSSRTYPHRTPFSLISIFDTSSCIDRVIVPFGLIIVPTIFTFLVILAALQSNKKIKNSTFRDGMLMMLASNLLLWAYLIKNPSQVKQLTKRFFSCVTPTTQPTITTAEQTQQPRHNITQDPTDHTEIEVGDAVRGNPQSSI